jgi:hypothetical protein
LTVQNLKKNTFGIRLSEVVSPAHPVRNVQSLKGRERELESISRSLFAEGRHIFIYGDRGVGKSSLAATAANEYLAGRALPIFVSGSVNDTFKTIVANIVYQAIGRSRTQTVKKNKSAAFEWKFKFGSSTEVSPLDIAGQIVSVGDAVELLKQVASSHSERPIVVLDEFDTIGEQDERSKFAAMLKQLGDQSVNLKFIFTGIGRTLDELLGAHQSAYRQLDTVELLRLGWDARREIVDIAAAAFGLTVDNSVNWRIATVSDGFPYYIHLLTEKMLWEAFADEDNVSVVDFKHFHPGLRTAIESINAELRKPYEMAVSHRSQEFEDVVWSTADGEELYRSLADLHQSYKMVLRKRQDRPELDRKKYTETIRKLKGKLYGEILSPVTGRQGWYTYREKMLRGYVRRQAEANRVELSGERAATRQRMHGPGNARTGFNGPSFPPGVNVNEERTYEDRGDGGKQLRVVKKPGG